MENNKMRCRDVRESLVDRTLSPAGPQLTETVASHLESCASCRAYAAGVRAAPPLFGGAPLYRPTLKQRALAAVDAAQDSKDVGFGLLLALPAALSLLLSILGQIYLVHFACSAVVQGELLAWVVSIAIAWASGAAIGLLVLVFLARKSRPARQAYGGAA